MSDRPNPPHEGQLLAAALKTSGLSAREAAKRAGISEGRWRQIVSGYQVVSAGHYAPVRGPADTIARMARVVDASPEDLEQAGRQDAATELRRQVSNPGPTASPEPTPLSAELADAIATLQRNMEQILGAREKEIELRAAESRRQAELEAKIASLEAELHELRQERRGA